jgi:tetratricopeptide (TPR) repeat protein
MDDDNSYLVGYELVDAQLTSLRGQRWAEPSLRSLRRTMRHVYEHRSEAAAVGARARADVLVSCAPEHVAAAVRNRLEAIDRHAVHLSRTSLAMPAQWASPPSGRRPTKGSPRMSACVVVQGNSASLAQCLASLDGIADASVVVDAESGDDMGSARNEALDQATGAWVLMLDADHTLDPASVDALRGLVDHDRFVGYAARELHQFGMDGAVSGVEQRTAVLFPRHPDLRYVGRVNEQLLPQRPGLDFRLVSSPVILHQHDRRSGHHDLVAKARRDLPVLERSVREAPREPFHLYNLGAALDRLGLHGEAETALRRAIELAAPRAIWGAAAYASLSRAVAAQGRHPEAVKLCKAATKWAPDWAHGWCMLGAALVDAGRLSGALRAYTQALNCTGDRWVAGSGPDDTAWQVRAGMGKVHLVREDYEQASQCLSAAVGLDPSNEELRLWLGRAEEALGRTGEAGRHLERATAVARAGPESYLAVGNFFAKRAEDALLRGLADNPESRALLERIERLRAVQAMER